MDFGRVLRLVLQGLAERRVRFAAIGGFALAALGVPRTTADLDLLVHREDLPQLDQVLEGIGYQRLVRTDNVSHYRHADAVWGSVDVLHAFRAFALAMLERAQPQAVFGGTQTIRVVQPEDVIGLKVQAMANDPSRRVHEVADIESLLAAYGPRLDWSRIQEYYELFEMGEEARRLRERFGHAQ